MDVQCDRCKTEYEFDDALVTGRGTTVRCTHCGHQFKVHQAEGSIPAEDRWVIRTGDGEQVTFSTLRDLQQAILSKRIRRADALLRGTGSPRPLGSISELEPFFEGRTSSRPPPFDPAAPQGAALSPVPPVQSAPFWPHDDDPAGLAPPQGPAPAASMTERYRPASPVGPVVATPSAETPWPSTAGAGTPPADGSAAWPTVPSAARGAAALPSAQAEVRWGAAPSRSGTGAFDGERSQSWSAAGARRSISPFDDEVASLRQGPPSSGSDAYSMARRRSAGGWIVAVVLLLAVGVVGRALAKSYLTARAPPAAPELDPRVQSLLSEGERAMRGGRLDAAQGDFDKASVLAEADPHVLLDEAEVAVEEADIPWLRLRLLPPERVDEIRTTKAQLDEIIARVRRSSEQAVAAAPQDAAALRTNVDALRLADDREAARAAVAKIIGQASRPRTAYVLAALDLAEPMPPWPTIVERLRLASGTEDDAGRVQAALVYALARSGDAAAARVELSKLESAARPYPLLPALHEFVDRSAALVRDRTPVEAVRPEPSPRNRRVQSVSPAPDTATGPAPSDPISSDPGAAMQYAARALKRADFTRARQIYQSVVDRNPNDSEAIAGLGDVARLQGDSSGAVEAYKHAIAVNPSYLPALLGLADTQWAGGDRASAAKAYGDVVDRFPEGTYPAYVVARAATSAGASSGPPRASLPSPAPSIERIE